MHASPCVRLIAKTDECVRPLAGCIPRTGKARDREFAGGAKSVVGESSAGFPTKISVIRGARPPRQRHAYPRNPHDGVSKELHVQDKTFDYFTSL